MLTMMTCVQVCPAAHPLPAIAGSQQGLHVPEVWPCNIRHARPSSQVGEPTVFTQVDPSPTPAAAFKHSNPVWEAFGQHT